MREHFAWCLRTYSQDGLMKAFLPSRPELRWIAVAIPALFLGHWMVTTLCHRLLGVIPDSLRAVLQVL
jgi:hypothetical protein